jgi:Ca2+-binding RTX toxin-like protein
VYWVDDAGDRPAEFADEGTDTLFILTGAFSLTSIAPKERSFERIHLAGSVTTMTGGGGNDELVVNPAAPTTLAGGDGNDTLWGGTLGNRLEGGPGRDVFYGGGGPETMVGGTGDDQYVIRNAATVVIEASGGGTDTVWVEVDGYTMPFRVEIGRLLAANATLAGTGSGDVMAAQAAGATLEGADGADELWAAASGSTLRGGEGLDTLRGSLGDDVLEGGAGSDQLVGLGGADRFVFGMADWGQDEVFGFDAAQGDRLDMRGSGATGFADLAVVALGGNSAVLFGGASIAVYGAALTAGDFIF